MVVLDIVRAFWSTTLELAPWLLLGCLIAGVMHVLVPRDLIRRHLGGNRFLDVVKAVAFGVPLPLCSCGVLPAALGLKKQGASDGAVVGFLISTPQTGVDSIAVTGAMLGWPFALLKVVAAIVTGLVGGIGANLAGNGETQAPEDAKGDRKRLTSIRTAIADVIEFGFLDMLGGIWKWLLMGLVVSALITAFIPQDALTGRVWSQGLVGMLAMLVISTPLYICTTGSLPVAAALVRAGMSPGCALVFLMAGPATNAATLAAVYRALGRRTAAVYLGTIVLGSLLFGRLFDFVISVKPVALAHHHAGAFPWISWACALLLLGLLAHFAWRELRDVMQRRAGKAAAQPDLATVAFVVTGLKCQNCVRKLHTALGAAPGVQQVDIDLSSGRTEVQGSGITSAMLHPIVTENGFGIT